MNDSIEEPGLDYYQEMLDNFLRQLARYIENPDEEAIHEIRRSIRRLQAAYQALPQHCKTEVSRTYLKRIRRFFRLNSQVRDYDVIAGKLKKLGSGQGSALLKALKSSRKTELRHALKEAKKLSELTPPRFKAKPDRHGALAMQVQKRARNFDANRPLVLADENNAEEIHEMRKDAKKLFYLLEQDETMATLRQMIHIKLFQRLTGEIHDADVAIDFLSARAEHCDDSARLLEILGGERHVLYRELVGVLEDGEWQDIARLGQP